MSAGACRDAGQRGKAWLRHLGPVLLGLGLFGLGIWAMHRLLQPLHAGEILEQMRTMPHSVLAIALAATACGYTALIGYDFWALKYLEKKLPLRVVALGGRSVSVSIAARPSGIRSRATPTLARASTSASPGSSVDRCAIWATP